MKKKISIFFIFVIIGLILSFKSCSIETKSTTIDIYKNDVLIVTESSFDKFLGDQIQNHIKWANYTIKTVLDLNNSYNYFLRYILNADFTSIIIISQTLPSLFNNTLMNFIDQLLLRNGSFTLISSKIWQIQESILSKYDLSINKGGINEVNPNGNKSIQPKLKIVLDDYLHYPHNFSADYDFNISSILGIIETTSNNIKTIAETNDIDPRQNYYTTSGIYVNNSHGIINFIPISLRNSNNLPEVDLITSLLYYTLDHAQSVTILSTQATTTQTLNFSQTIVPENNAESIKLIEIQNGGVETVLGVTTVLGLSSVSYYSYKTLTAIPRKKEEIPDDEIFSTDLPWYLFIISFVIWTVNAVIHSNKNRRMTYFQIQENSLRQQILTILEKEKYIHINSLRKKLGTGVSITLWHLQVLEDFEIIKMEKFGQFKIIYLLHEKPSINEIELYCYLRSKIAYTIIKSFTKKYTWELSDLSEIYSLNPESIKYHLVKFHHIGILTFNEKTRTYSLNTKKFYLINKILQRNDLFN